jgi:dTDP-4-amino-4,6-dideoxygalactose transaminase
LDTKSVLPVNAARTALALALKRLGVGPGDAVLVPAYHCPSMVEPIVWVGATPVFYRIDWDTSADLDDLRAKLDASTRAVLAVHYFGFPKNMLAVRDLCGARGLALIEDCAHCFFGQIGAQPVGSIGTYAIASAVKFFPVADGGYLASASAGLGDAALRSPGGVASVKALVSVLDRAIACGRFSYLRPLMRSANGLRNAIRRTAPREAHTFAQSHAASASDLPDDANDRFDPEAVDLRMSLTSRLVVRQASKCRIVERRRANYLRLLEGLSDLPGCTPLFRELPDGAVPYMFPLLFDDVERAYPALAREAIPITHFAKYMCDGVSPSTCPVTTAYSRRMLQFSCHQEVTMQELDWMVERMQHVMRSLTPSGARS